MRLGVVGGVCRCSEDVGNIQVAGGCDASNMTYSGALPWKSEGVEGLNPP